MHETANGRIKEAIIEMVGPVPMIRFTLEFRGGCGQGYGPFDLNFLDFGRLLPVLLRVTGARNWDGLKGRYVRVRRDGAGMVEAIGALVEDDWVAIGGDEYARG